MTTIFGMPERMAFFIGILIIAIILALVIILEQYLKKQLEQQILNQNGNKHKTQKTYRKGNNRKH